MKWEKTFAITILIGLVSRICKELKTTPKQNNTIKNGHIN